MAIGVQPFIGIKPGIGFPVARMLGLESMAAAAEPRQPSHRIGGFRPQGCLRRQIRSRIDQQDPSTTVSQGQGSNATAGPRADDDGIPGSIDWLALACCGHAQRQKKIPDGGISNSIRIGGGGEI